MRHSASPQHEPSFLRPGDFRTIVFGLITAGLAAAVTWALKDPLWRGIACGIMIALVVVYLVVRLYLADKLGSRTSTELSSVKQRCEALENELAKCARIPLRARESDAAEALIAEIRSSVMKPSHMGSHPSIARVALLHTRSFTTASGVEVTLREYLEMLKESAAYEDLRDVTFLARVEPSDWVKEEDGEKKDQAWRYLTFLAEIKEKNPKIRMRRILVLETDVYDNEKAKTDDFAYFKNMHEDAKVDLIHMTPTQLASARFRAKGQDQNGDWLEDLAVFVGEDDGHRGWTLESNYDYKLEPSSEQPVKVWMWCNEHHCMDHFPCLFEIIDNLYNHGAPGEFINRVNEDWRSNAPERDYLRKARILTGVPAT